MFEECKAYIKSKLTLIGITDIRHERGAAVGIRQATYYSMPSRCRLSTAFENSKENVKNYTDPDDKVPVRASGITDAADNTATAVKDTDADFVTAGVVAGDMFINAVTNQRAAVVTRTDSKNLVLAAGVAGGNSISYRICDHHGRSKIRVRKKKADMSLTFVVEFQNRNLASAYADFLNFNRVLGKSFHDGQFAKYVKPDGTSAEDPGNEIQITLGAVEFGDNSYYPELVNKIIQEVEFSGGIYINPDPASGEIEFDPVALSLSLYIDIET